ncbi:hypothetical protein CBR_g658 [Chara braunii]|uniref:amidophosphoribosyltransferase n=1 Tax=Chara braunii TaxID=69332 RepID=A0A388KBX9_CHABU|nr:hypothetical protein CBR_g658 [Chara braunii]|eukprot:GBG67527.1 hypothetical protein CBR_g658 [Chara braunii]
MALSCTRSVNVISSCVGQAAESQRLGSELQASSSVDATVLDWRRRGIWSCGCGFRSVRGGGGGGRRAMARWARAEAAEVGGSARGSGAECRRTPMAERVHRIREAAMRGATAIDRKPRQEERRGGEEEEEENVEEEEVGMEHDFMREECGVVGVHGSSEASRLCYLSLHALQHRGQEGAGIATYDDQTGSLRTVTGMGLVADVFNAEKLKQLPGTCAIGHVRYATSGASSLKNVQPFVAGYRFGSVGLAHNGNLVNYWQLREMLEEEGSIFNTSSDTEVILHLIAKSKQRPFISRLVEACEQLEGAYSLVFITEGKLVAVRDPYGFRPLVMGRRKDDGTIVFASETCALDLIEVAYEREVNPGEVVVVDTDGSISSICLLPKRKQQACVFEHIYFALPNSDVFGRSVYQSRFKFGEILAEVAPVECDVVIAVPDSGVVCALGYAAKAGVPFQQGLIRSHYVGRTFIEPSQKIRDFGVKLKLAPVRAVLNGKRVVVVDDSIVRGTTSSKIVRLLKEAGAKEVHMRISSPPITGSCYYGVDTPSREELISATLSEEETRKFIGADSLVYLPLNKLHEMLGEEAPFYCDACFSGNYAVHPSPVYQASLPVDRLSGLPVAALDGCIGRPHPEAEAGQPVPA